MSPTALGVVASARVASNSPADIPGLEAWYDAADASTFTLTGALVEQWRDKSGKGVTLNAADAAQRPSRSGTQNGRLVVTFNNSFMRTVGGATSIGAATSAVSIFVACKRSAASATYNEIPVGLTGGGSGGRPLTGWGSNRYVGATAYSGYIDIGTSTTLKSWATLTHEVNMSALDVVVTEYLNGVKGRTAQTYTTFTTAAQVVSVGRRDDIATSFLGDIAEALIYGRVLTAPERGTVDTYLRAKWGTP